jgi:DNA mismatch repair ATPase MutS
VPISPSSTTEIHSASTELLTSDSLEQLRKLLADAFNERDELTKEVSSATYDENAAIRRYQNWERGFLFRRVFKKSFVTRKEAAETAVAKLAELQEQLRLTTIATEINVDREQAEPYYRMRDAFAALSECQKIWNVLTEKEVDRVAERSSSDTAVTRTSVFSQHLRPNPMGPDSAPSCGIAQAATCTFIPVSSSIGRPNKPSPLSILVM